jgi:hypothetical protein
MDDLLGDVGCELTSGEVGRAGPVIVEPEAERRLAEFEIDLTRASGPVDVRDALGGETGRRPY